MKRFIQTNAFKIFVVVIVWQAALLLIGNLMEVVNFDRGVNTGLANDPSLLGHTMRWDSGWILNVTENFYQDNPASAAFYPLFPLLVRGLSAVSFGWLSFAAAGFVINFVASFFAVYGLYKIAQILLKNQNAALYTSLLFLCFPTAFFIHAFYSEALFCAVAFWAYFFALRRRWLLCCLLLAALTASRLPSLLFIGLCALEYLRSKDWRLKTIGVHALYFLLAPAGFVFYGLFLKMQQHGFWGMFSAYKATTDWDYQQFSSNILLTIARPLKNTAALLFGQAPLSIGSFNYNVTPGLSLVLLIGSSAYLLKKVRGWAVPLGIFGLASAVFFTLNNNVVSVQRYVLACLPIYLLFGWLYTQKANARWLLFLLAAIFLVFQITLFSLFVLGYFVG